MTEVVNRLREGVESVGFEADAETFDLLAAACVACCLEINGGNKTCPPKVDLNDATR
jgi:hypothetical protein